MGTSLTNFHLRTDDRAAVAEVARSTIRNAAWLSPAHRGWTSLYDGWPDRHDVDFMHQRLKHLSACLLIPAVGFLLHDSNVFVYVLYDKGVLKDEYCSDPGFVKAVDEAARQRLEGRPDVLLEYSVQGTSFSAVQDALRPAAPPTGRDSAVTADFVDVMRDRLRASMPSTVPTTEALQQMLLTLADQMHYLPPAMLEQMLSSLGVPPNHPALAALKSDPGGFLKQMASNPMVLQQFSSQLSSVLSAPTASAPSNSFEVESRLIGLSQILGIDERFAALDYAQFESGEAERLLPDIGPFQRLVN